MMWTEARHRSESSGGSTSYYHTTPARTCASFELHEYMRGSSARGQGGRESKLRAQ